MAPPLPKQLTVDRRRRQPLESIIPNDIDDSSGSLLVTPASSNLWVGNLSLDTTESELSALFAKYGALDRVTAYPSRNYAFVYFKHIEDARAAKETLQGALVRGNQIKIQYAKPVRCCLSFFLDSDFSFSDSETRASYILMQFDFGLCYLMDFGFCSIFGIKRVIRFLSSMFLEIRKKKPLIFHRCQRLALNSN